MTLPPFVRVDGSAVHLSLKVQPRASRNEVGEVLGSELKVKVTAPPVDSAANEALVEFLAATLAVPRSRIQVTRGATCRHKTVTIQAANVERVISILAPQAGR